eukprot:scaffold19864_cov101-Isochrysis_galbana.AAC.3
MASAMLCSTPASIWSAAADTAGAGLSEPLGSASSRARAPTMSPSRTPSAMPRTIGCGGGREVGGRERGACARALASAAGRRTIV